MASESKPPPLDELRACLLACTRWLADRGYVLSDATIDENTILEGSFLLDNFKINAPDDETLKTLDEAQIQEIYQRYAVRHVILWLSTEVLPALDGRREDERLRISNRTPDEFMPNPEAFANLYFGNDEHEAAAKVRNVLASARRLRPLVAAIAQRQQRRDLSNGQSESPSTLALYERWVAFGEAVQLAIEPASLGGMRALRVPHTIEDWNHCRESLELYLHEVGLEDSDIVGLLPGGGDANSVKRRRYRSRQKQARSTV